MTASEELVRRTTFSVTGSPASMSVPCELLLLVGAVLTPLLLAYAERSVLLVAPDGERSALQDRTENDNRFKTKAHSHKLANRAPWFETRSRYVPHSSMPPCRMYTSWSKYWRSVILLVTRILALLARRPRGPITFSGELAVSGDGSNSEEKGSHTENVTGHMGIDCGQDVIEEDPTTTRQHRGTQCYSLPTHKSALAYTARASATRARCPPLNYNYRLETWSYLRQWKLTVIPMRSPHRQRMTRCVHRRLTSVANLSHIALWEDRQIRLQCTSWA